MTLKHLSLAGLGAGLYLLAALASAGQPEEKGTITTLDTSHGLISIDTHDMYIGAYTRVQTMKGRTRSLRDLAANQRVRYSLNEQNEITRLWIYPTDIEELIKLGYDVETGEF